MSERRAHWDFDLVKTVVEAMNRYGSGTVDSAFATIAAVEDWQAQHEIVSAPAVLIAQQATIQRVREWIEERLSRPIVSDYSAGYAAAVDDMMRVLGLDGERDE